MTDNDQVQACFENALALLKADVEAAGLSNGSWSTRALQAKNGIVVQVGSMDSAFLREVGAKLEEQGFVCGGYEFMGVPNDIISFTRP